MPFVVKMELDKSVLQPECFCGFRGSKTPDPSVATRQAGLHNQVRPATEDAFATSHTAVVKKTIALKVTIGGRVHYL